MQVKIYQADAFTDILFGGNPAAVIPLDKWIPETLMQQIAAENNLAETAFYVKVKDVYEIRWFTPLVEVDLCGHATLAAAFVLYCYEGHAKSEIHFFSERSGALTVKKDGALLTLNFPSDIYKAVPITKEFTKLFTIPPLEAYLGKTDYMFVFASQEEIESIRPDFTELKKLDCRGVIVTAKGNECDFVSRFFAPACGIDEDPVTGSAHTTLIPYWAGKLAKNDMSAIQLSKRKGHLECRYLNERVEISGKAKIYLIGDLLIS